MEARETRRNGGEGERLELGLGFTRSTPSSSSSSLTLGFRQSGFGITTSFASNIYDPLLPSSLTWFSASPPPPPLPLPPPWPMVSAGGFLLDRQTPVVRSPSALWFTLLSSINRNGEVLPQVPKAYIRVRDDNVTILIVQKYLVTKLGLSHEIERRWRKRKENLESCTQLEIDISCMGEKLLQCQTLRHVWDSVWMPRIMESGDSRAALVGKTGDCRSMNCLMSLQYGRRCFFN